MCSIEQTTDQNIPKIPLYLKYYMLPFTNKEVDSRKLYHLKVMGKKLSGIKR